MEKHWHFTQIRSSTVLSNERCSGDLDEAFKYLQVAGAGAIYNGDDVVSLKRLRRKIDRRIVPILFLCYATQVLAEATLEYASNMSLPKDLDFDIGELLNIQTTFFGIYIAAQLINVIALLKLPPVKWLGVNILVCGIACSATAGAINYTTLLLARLSLAAFSAAILPSLILITSQWYRKHEQVVRISVWYCGLGAARVVGSLMSYGFQNVETRHKSLAGWRIMFLTVGGATLTIGLATLTLLPDTPMKAKFLSERETVALLGHVSVNRTGIKNSHFVSVQMKDAMLDPQTWLLVLASILLSTASTLATTSSNTIFSLWDYSSQASTLLASPSGGIIILLNLLASLLIRHRLLPRSLTLIACLIPALAGACLIASTPPLTRADSPRVRLFIGIYLTNTASAGIAILFAWTAANIGGSTKRVFSTCLVASSVATGEFISLHIRSGETAKIVVVTMLAASVGLAAMLGLWYYWRNGGKMEPRSAKADGCDSSERWKNQTDGRNPRFRYVY